MEKSTTQEMSLEEFMNYGLLFYINLILQPMGISLLMRIDNKGKPKKIVPVRTELRGYGGYEFDAQKHYEAIAKYFKDNIRNIDHVDKNLF